MKESVIVFGALCLPVYSLNTVVVGTGAAGYNAANRLFEYGQRDIIIVTENTMAGTSRNTGSDKQTYYKLTLSGNDPDSVRDMAETLFSGQCVDGDIALCEAALSAQSFFKLVELGVPFPKNRFGEYIGYKTDHDPRRRATSVGPYTSRKMTECLQAAVEAKGIRVLDRMQVVKILGDGRQAFGLLCLDLNKLSETQDAFVLFNCKNIVYATGGPAGMYANSVYPYGQYGASGLAFEAGIIGKNLTEWQFGLASVSPRWNVSGSFMQALPHMFSTDANGGDEREFMSDSFHCRGDMLTRLFLKGYQWPFDVRKASNGSSAIDILVYHEQLKGRRVFLDYRRNPNDEPIDFHSLSEEASGYLQRAEACFGTPIQRLAHMNLPAIDFYGRKGVNLWEEPLEIALCVQHNNGGLDIDCWWQTNLEGFFAAGEVSASHGIYRPGGSALNAGQVGSMRAAQYITARRWGEPMEDVAFSKAVLTQVTDVLMLSESMSNDEDNVKEMWDMAAGRMSRIGGAIRNRDDILQGLSEIRHELTAFSRTARVCRPAGLGMALRLRDMLICQEVYLSAMVDYIDHGGKSRGSALYTDPEGTKPKENLPDQFLFSLDNGIGGNLVQEVARREGEIVFRWREVRPIPEDDDFFENVWRSFRENGNVF